MEHPPFEIWVLETTIMSTMKLKKPGLNILIGAEIYGKIPLAYRIYEGFKAYETYLRWLKMQKIDTFVYY